MSAENVCFEQEVVAGGSWTSNEVALRDGKNVHALEIIIADDGTLDVTVYTSVSGRDYISNGVKGSALTKTSGPGSDGRVNIPLRLSPGDFLKVKLEETGGINSITASVYFVQK